MADEEENGLEESEDTAPEEGGGKSKKWLIILIVVVVLLGGGGVAAWKVVPGLLSSDDKASGDEAGDKSGSGKEESEEDLPSVMHSLKPFIVNLLGQSGKRYLKLSIDLELNGEATKAGLQSRISPIRDSLLILLSSKTFDDIKTVEGKMRLRMEIISRINTQLKKGRVKNAYFTDFVVQ